jgi:hypothetical protein
MVAFCSCVYLRQRATPKYEMKAGDREVSAAKPYQRFCQISFLALLWVFPPFLLALGSSGFAQTPNGEPPAPRTPNVESLSTEELEAWRLSMTHAPSSGRGCFTANYPETQWQQVPCTTPPPVPYPPARGGQPSIVGNGADVAGLPLVLAPRANSISEAIGSFDSAQDITSESGTVGGANAFSLQLNSNRFTTPACDSAADPGKCQGWEQFVFSNTQSHSAYIQYWLLGYGKTKCPSGWNYYNNAGDDQCFMSQEATSTIPTQPITNLLNLSITGRANADSTDTLVFSLGRSLYKTEAVPSVLNLEWLADSRV